MRFPASFPLRSHWLIPLLCVIACGGVAYAQGSANLTTITGTVYSPLGPPNSQNPTAPHGDPIPNILVYAVPSALPPFTTQGVVQGGCAAQPSLVPATVLGEALTDANGNFTFTSQTMPGSVDIVVQAGKWRQQYPNTAVNVGGTTNLPALTMPAGQGPLADLPHIAIITGEADAIECIFRKIGISDSEITDPSGAGSINLYEGTGDLTSGGAVVNQSDNPIPSEVALLSKQATLDSYDLVMFGCQGTPTDLIATSPGDTGGTMPGDPGGERANILNYTTNGGRIFATHYGYVWLENIQSYDTSADWLEFETYSSTDPVPTTVDTSYPEGVILAAWLKNIGALSNVSPPEVELSNVRVDLSAVNNPPAQSWVTLNGSPGSSIPGNPPIQFTFDTPVGVTETPTVTIAYTNNTTTFMQGDAGDSITLNVTNNSTAATGPGLILTIALPGGLTATSLVGVGNTGWACNLATLVCTNTGLASGAFDSVMLTFSIAPDAQAGKASLTASLSGGNLSGTGQCGRVLFNDYHVEDTTFLGSKGSFGATYPAECSPGPLTAAEKFLEFSLYNLSNFVSPSTTDPIVIQGTPTINWPQPASIPYGTPLSSAQLDATATDTESGATIPGTFVYTPAADAIPATGDDTVSVVFTPADLADYTSASAHVMLQVTQDSTITTLTPPVTPIYYGQIIADTATEGVSTTGPAALDGGSLYFEIDGAITCAFIEPIPPGASHTCPPTTGAGYNAGATYSTQSVYTGDTNFSPSSSPIYPVQILPDPTTTALISSATSSLVGQPITLTATVGDQYTTAAGVVTFLDGATQIGGIAVNSQGAAMLTLSTLNAGSHSITACLVTSQNFLGSCSPAVTLIVTASATAVSTVTLLTSSINPSVVGQSVTFSASVESTGTFVSVPAGTVTFFDGATALGTPVMLDAKGNATLSTSTLTAGLHTITAVYAGNAATMASTSAPVMQQVNTPLTSAGTGFLMTVTPATVSVGAGSSTGVSVTILELNNFNQPVQLSCSGLPAEATCTFATSLIPAAGGTTQLLISAAAPHNCGSNTPYFVAQGGRTGLSLFAVAVLAFFARRRRALKGLFLAAVIGIFSGLSGCGTGNCTDLGTKPGTYTFTVTGTSTGSDTIITPVVATPAAGNVVTQSQTVKMTVTI